jgi:hypothetical protein
MAPLARPGPTPSHLFTLRAPLVSRPVRGAVFGATIGLLYGVGLYFNGAAARAALGAVAAGAVAGMMIGGLLPLFRRRLLGGLVVGLALACGYLLAT